MGNCLITKLNTTVSENLDKLGSIVIYAIKNGSDNNISNRVTVKGSIGTKISVDGDGYFSQNYEDMVNKTDCVVEYTLETTSSYTFYFSNNTYNIYISNKYEIISLEVVSKPSNGGVKLTTNENQIKYSTSLKTLCLSYGFAGDIDFINTMESMYSLNLSNYNNFDLKNIANVSYNNKKIQVLQILNNKTPIHITDLKFKNIKILNIDNFSGDVLDYVNMMKSMGLTEYKIEWSHLLDIAIFNGKKYSGAYSYLEWNDDKVAVLIKASSNSTDIVKVYCYNWTQEDKDLYPGVTIIDV